MTILDTLHVMLIVHTLSSTYEVVQQTILENVRDYKMLTSTDMRAQLLSEELCQGNTSVYAIKARNMAVRPTLVTC